MNSWGKIWKIKGKIKIIYSPCHTSKAGCVSFAPASVPFLLFPTERAQDDQSPPQSGLADPEVFDVIVFEDRKKDKCH